jgi:hypothetical protein
MCVTVILGQVNVNHPKWAYGFENIVLNEGVSIRYNGGVFQLFGYGDDFMNG